MSGIRSAFQSLLPRVAEAALAHYGDNLVSLAVFGSVARGVPRPDSDVDLLLVCRDLPRGHRRRLEGFERVEDALAPELERLRAQGVATRLSPVLLTREEARQGRRLFLDMVDHALILHDPDGFLTGLLASLRRRLEAAGARRARVGAAWVWLLPPGFELGEGGR